MNSSFRLDLVKASVKMHFCFDFDFRFVELLKCSKLKLEIFDDGVVIDELFSGVVIERCCWLLIERCCSLFSIIKSIAEEFNFFCLCLSRYCRPLSIDVIGALYSATETELFSGVAIEWKCCSLLSITNCSLFSITNCSLF